MVRSCSPWGLTGMAEFRPARCAGATITSKMYLAETLKCIGIECNINASQISSKLARGAEQKFSWWCSGMHSVESRDINLNLKYFIRASQPLRVCRRICNGWKPGLPYICTPNSPPGHSEVTASPGATRFARSLRLRAPGREPQRHHAARARRSDPGRSETARRTSGRFSNPTH